MNRSELKAAIAKAGDRRDWDECDRLEALLDESDRNECREVLSRLSSWLGSGLGDDSVTAEQYEERIRCGVDMLTRPLVERVRELEAAISPLRKPDTLPDGVPAEVWCNGYGANPWPMSAWPKKEDRKKATDQTVYSEHYLHASLVTAREQAARDEVWERCIAVIGEPHAARIREIKP